MSTSPVLTFTISAHDFDRTLLPEEARTPGTRAFREAVQRYVEGQFDSLGGWRTVNVGAHLIEVRWTPRGDPPDPLDQVITKLNTGDYAGSITLLQLFLSDRPTDVSLLYNLGMALSDVGRLAEAEHHLRQACALAPDFANAHVALGVALQRQRRNEEAIEVLGEAVRMAPDNPWAHRNLAACLLAAGRPQEAEGALRNATTLNPEDQQAWVGLGNALEELGRTDDADAAYRNAIDLDQYSAIAEVARQARGKLAHMNFRAQTESMERLDAVMYCLGAIERYEKMSSAEVQRIAFEIALLGTKGLDVNDPVQKYRLNSLPGSFNGLHLVCLMYVGFKLIAPEADVGFDLGKEYEAARRLHVRGDRS